MKEIKIILNDNEETFCNKGFSVLIDGEELKNVNSFSLNAVQPEPDERGFIDTDKIVTYTVDHYAPVFEVTEEEAAKFFKKSDIRKEDCDRIKKFYNDPMYWQTVRSMVADMIDEVTIEKILARMGKGQLTNE